MAIKKEKYSTFDIIEIFNIKIDRLKDWIIRGYISPSIQRASGQGTKNIFSKFDLYLIALFKFLISRGFSRDDAAERIEMLRQYKKKTIAMADYLMIGGKYKDNWPERDLKRMEFNPKVMAFKSIQEVRIPGKFVDCDDLLIVNFRKIREQIDLLAGKIS